MHHNTLTSVFTQSSEVLCWIYVRKDENIFEFSIKFSTLRWWSYIKLSLVEDQASFILQCLYHCYWCPGDTRGWDISSQCPSLPQHYSDVIMGAMASQITSLSIFILNRSFRGRSKKSSKLRVTGLCAGNSPVTGEFPAQMASNAKNVSIWWCHYDILVSLPAGLMDNENWKEPSGIKYNWKYIYWFIHGRYFKFRLKWFNHLYWYMEHYSLDILCICEIE